MLLDFHHIKTGTGFSLRGERLFEISEVEITRVDCMSCKLEGILNKKEHTEEMITADSV